MRTVDLISGDKVITRKQLVENDLESAKKIFKETCQIDWKKSIHEIHNLIRGLSPYPAAWTNLINNEERIFIKIYSASKEMEPHKLELGKVIASKKELKISVEGGFILLEEIQLEGKKRMPVSIVLNGLKLSENARFR